MPAAPAWARRAALLALGLALLASVAVAPAGDARTQDAKLTASDGAPEDRVGESVSLDGDTALVGAPGEEDEDGFDAAYVFVRSGGTWTEQATLTASDAEPNDDFGEAVSLDGDRALIGAERSGVDGAVYVFERGGTSWTEQAKLTASDGEQFDFFGRTVGLDGDRALIGAPWDDNANGENAGAVYVFERQSGTWSQQAKLTRPDGQAFDYFGEVVSLDGDRALIGAEDVGPYGATYVFERVGSTWTQRANLTVEGDPPEYGFGTSVSLDGDRALVGADGDNNTHGELAGAAYVFTSEGGTWSQEAKLVAEDVTNIDQFGSAVSLVGDHALMSAPLKHTSAEDAGAAYEFALSDGTWTQQAKLVADDASPDDEIGEAVAIGHRGSLVGAPLDDVDGDTNQGSAYFHATGLPTNLRATPAAQAGAVELDWEAVRGVFHVKRSTSSGGPYTEIATTTGTSYTDTGLGDRTYHYVVTRELPDGSQTDPSSEVSAHPRPPAPPNLDASPGDQDGEVDLDWQAPAGWNPSLYRVYRSTQDGGPYQLVDDTGQTGYTDTGLDPSTTYHYVLTAVDSDLESPLSDQVSAEPAGTTADPPSSTDDGQNDAGTGGDASDDPDDPTILAGGELIRINGTLIPVLDPVDAYGTQISPNATTSMRFHFNVPATMGLELTLLDPDGNVHDQATAPLQGGEIEVEAVAADGEHLDEGVWVTVLEHGTSAATPLSASMPWAAPSAGGAVGSAAPAPPASHVPVGTRVDPHLSATGDGTVPDAVPDWLTVIDYRDKRPCNPRC